MAVHLIKEKANTEQMLDMLQLLGSYIKLAVDVERGILAGGGALHADCEEVLLENGSKQENVWGADWLPFMQEITFESLINIRPNQDNSSMEIEDESLRVRIEVIVRNLLEETAYE